jgi:NAD+ diphosphatase
MFPGGGIKRKETAAQAVEREIFEEIGIHIKDLKRIGEYSSTQEFKRDTAIVFKAKSDTKDIQIDTKEIAEARWFKLDDLPAISEYSKKILGMLNV